MADDDLDLPHHKQRGQKTFPLPFDKSYLKDTWSLEQSLREFVQNAFDAGCSYAQDNFGIDNLWQLGLSRGSWFFNEKKPPKKFADDGFEYGYQATACIVMMDKWQDVARADDDNMHWTENKHAVAQIVVTYASKEKTCERKFVNGYIVGSRMIAVEIENRGRQFQWKNLCSLGAGDKQDNRLMAGKFGEGIKVGALAAIRDGFDFELHANSTLYRYMIPESGRYADKMVLKVCGPRKIELRNDCVNVRIKCGDPDNVCDLLAFPSKLFLVLQQSPDNPTKAVSGGWEVGRVLLSQEDKNKFYSKGIFVYEEDELLFGYDIPIELTRDRNQPQSPMDVRRGWRKLVRTLMIQNKDPSIMTLLLQRLVNTAENGIIGTINHKEFYWMMNDQDLCKYFADAFRTHFGRQAFPCTEDVKPKVIERLRDRKPILISRLMLNILERGGYSNLVEEEEKLYSVENCSDLLAVNDPDAVDIFEKLIHQLEDACFRVKGVDIFFIKRDLLTSKNAKCQERNGKYFINDNLLRCVNGKDKPHDYQAYRIACCIIRASGDEDAEARLTENFNKSDDDPFKVQPQVNSVVVLMGRRIANRGSYGRILDYDNREVIRELSVVASRPSTRVNDLKAGSWYTLELYDSEGNVLKDPRTGALCTKNFKTKLALKEPTIHVLWDQSKGEPLVVMEPIGAPSIELGITISREPQRNENPVMFDCDQDKHKLCNIKVCIGESLSFVYCLKDSECVSTLNKKVILSNDIITDTRICSICECKYIAVDKKVTIRVDAPLCEGARVLLQGFESIDDEMECNIDTLAGNNANCFVLIEGPLITNVASGKRKYRSILDKPLDDDMVWFVRLAVASDNDFAICSNAFPVDKERDVSTTNNDDDSDSASSESHSNEGIPSDNRNDDEIMFYCNPFEIDEDQEEALLQSFCNEQNTGEAAGQEEEETECSDSTESATLVQSLMLDGREYHVDKYYKYKEDQIVKILELKRGRRSAKCKLFVKFASTWFGQGYCGKCRYLKYKHPEQLRLAEIDSSPLQSKPKTWMVFDKGSDRGSRNFSLTFPNINAEYDDYPENKLPSCLELFAGVGGMSLGHSENFNVSWLVEQDNVVAANLKQLHPNSKLFVEDVNLFLKKCKNRVPGYPTRGEVDHISGGPPCQGYSIANRLGGREDEANRQLIFAQIDAAKILQPKTMVIENVCGVLRYKEILSRLLQRVILTLNYQVRVHILNANDFGSAQKRRRVIIFCAKRGWRLPDIPQVSHFNDGNVPSIQFVKDAIGDLEQVQPRPGIVEIVNSDDGGSSFTFNHTKSHMPRHAELIPKYSPAPTITGKKQWKHYNGNRMLTVREVARLFDFPDSYQLFGPETRLLGLLGNAVPVCLAKAISRSVYDTYKIMNDDEDDDDDREEEEEVGRS